MIIGGRRASLLLFLGDVAAFAVSLYVTLWLRYGTAPSGATLAPYGVPFTFLFALWTLVFYSAGLYSKRMALLPSRLPIALARTQAANIVFAALFFFFVPAFGITPKIILALYLVVSLALVLLWRLFLYPRLSARHTHERAVMLAAGSEALELAQEVNGNPRYGIRFLEFPLETALTDAASLAQALDAARATLLVVDTRHAALGRLMPTIYRKAQIEQKFQFVLFEDMYEEVFDRIPLSLLGHEWFLENVTTGESLLYAVPKRVVDIVGGVLMGVITVIATPLIFIANLFEGGGPLFIAQERYGRYGEPMTAYKFRSMRYSDQGAWKGETGNYVTRVGAFLRQTSLDEFPQFVNVLRGELSLVGPRNDIKALGARLMEALPYYEARYLVEPGITGWAQINQQYEQGNVSPQSIEETKTRLAYDFYYLKHRSFGLDILIALKTIKRMFFRVSSW